MKRVLNPYNRDLAKSDIDRAPDGWVLDIHEETRTEEQNRKLHPMIRDIQRQVAGCEAFTEKQMRLRFLNALEKESTFLPELEGGGLFPVGQSTAALNKTQFSALIELIYEYGAKHNVRWSDPAERIFAEYGHEKRAA